MIDISEHLGLVASISMRYTKVRPVEESDAYEWAIDGLLYAQKKFEPEKGFQFSTYATCCIRGHILNKIRRNIKRRKIQKPLPPNVFKAKEDTESKAKLLAWDILDSYPINNESDMMNKQIIVDYFINGMMLKEISVKTGLTKQRVHQRKDEALKVLAKQVA